MSKCKNKVLSTVHHLLAKLCVKLNFCFFSLQRALFMNSGSKLLMLQANLNPLILHCLTKQELKTQPHKLTGIPCERLNSLLENLLFLMSLLKVNHLQTKSGKKMELLWKVVSGNEIIDFCIYLTYLYKLQIIYYSQG